LTPISFAFVANSPSSNRVICVGSSRSGNEGNPVNQGVSSVHRKGYRLRRELAVEGGAHLGDVWLHVLGVVHAVQSDDVGARIVKPFGIYYQVRHVAYDLSRSIAGS
jgi:hypothetical protein